MQEHIRISHNRSTWKGAEKVEDRSSDHPGEEDDESDLAEKHQDAMEAKTDFWSISGSSIFRHHVQERQKVIVLHDSSCLLPQIC